MNTASISERLDRQLSRLIAAVLPPEPRNQSESAFRSAAVLAVASGSVVVVWSAIAPNNRRLPLLVVALGFFTLAIVFHAISGRLTAPSATYGVLASGLAASGIALDPRNWSLGLLLFFLASLHTAYFSSTRGVTTQIVAMASSFLAVSLLLREPRAIVDWTATTVAIAAFAFSILVARHLVEALVTDLVARAREQRAVAQLGSRALTETDIDALMTKAAEIVADTLAFERVVIFENIPGRETMPMRACVGLKASHEKTDSALTPGSFSRYTLESAEPVVIEDIAREDRFRPPRNLFELGIVAAVNVPIPGRDHPWGVLGVRTTRSRTPSESDVDFLSSIANVLGSAIEEREHEESLRSARASEAELHERLGAVVDASPVAIVETDVDRRVTVWNKVAENMFGWSRDEAIGAVLATTPPRLIDEASELEERVLAGEQIVNFETESMRRDGTFFPCSLSLAPHRDSRGNLVGIISLGTDLTSSKLAEEELTRSRELYRVVVENSHDMIAVLDPMGRFVFASPSYEQALGYGPEELVDVSPISLVHPSDVQRASDALRQTVTGQGPSVVELRMRHKRGSWVFVEGTTTSVLNENGQLQSILMNFRDISERRIAEEELREAEARYRLLVEQLPLVTYINVPGESGRWVYLSPQLEEILGFKPSDWTSDLRSFIDAIHPDDRERVTAERAASGGKGRIGLEYRLISKDGRLVWVRDEAVVVRDLSGKPLYVQGYLLDISSEREADAERQRLEAQLLHSQKMEAIGRLAGGIAHDFNNLLTAITGYSELIVSELDPASSLARDAEEIKRAAEQAAAMTQQLLAFSRRQVLQPTLLSPNEVIGHMEKMLQRLIGENIELVTALDPEISTIRFDRSQIEQVIMNLVVNARDAMPDGGQITIETSNASIDASKAAELGLEPGDYVVTVISDTGTGMDEETISHIFEPFFTTKEQGEGTGLGLATVHGIVEQSKGAIEVLSELDAGCTFHIYIPIARETAAADLSIPPLGETRGSESILLVEDEEMVRKLVGRVLRELGYEVFETSSGEEALAVSNSLERPIDLIVTDVVMPGMSGRELAESLTAMRPTARVLFMSGYTEEAIVHHGVSDGEAEFIGKPFTPQELAHKIRSVLERSGNGGAAQSPATAD
ncbi:MAG: PAS domain S-box protein [Gaiellaceae bacterium]|jgi:PAS domain S-box-containing protein